MIIDTKYAFEKACGSVSEKKRLRDSISDYNFWSIRYEKCHFIRQFLCQKVQFDNENFLIGWNRKGLILIGWNQKVYAVPYYKRERLTANCICFELLRYIVTSQVRK